MKGIFIICAVVISGLFLYKPKQDFVYVSKHKRNLISPELKECEMYRIKIEENLKEVKSNGK